MGSVQDYWDFFLLAQKSTLVSQLELLAHPSLDGIYLSVWVVLFLYAWEFVIPWRKGQRKLRHGFGLDVVYTIFNYLLFWLFLGTAVCEVTKLVFHHALHHHLGIEHLVAVRLNALPVWLRYVILVLAIDFLSYWGHRWLHLSDLLWRFHKVHHSARELDVLNAARQHWVERLFYPLILYVPLSLVGFAIQDSFYAGLFTALFSNFTHANLRIPLGPLKYVLNNPQIHLWHHAAAVDSKRNVNYGDALCMWDYLFRTAYLPDDRSELELGFDGIEAYPTTFWGQWIEPFRSRPRVGS